MDQHTTEAQAIAGLALQGTEIKMVGLTPFAIVPDGYEIKDLEKMLPEPTRKRGRIEALDLSSFIAVVNKHKGAYTEIYRSAQRPSFTAVFNANQGDGGAAGWGDFTAVYSCPLSAEWLAWFGANKQQMTQEGFAQFIEDNLPDMVEPPAADMLEISRTLQAKKKVNFASGIRLANGENQLTYEETIEGSAGAKGQLKVPELFTIGIPVFDGGPRYAVKARLRYRIKDGVLQMWFDLERPHKIIEDAVNQLKDQVEAETGLKTLHGRI